MSAMTKHIGTDIDFPSMGSCVGGPEIGYLYGQVRPPTVGRVKLFHVSQYGCVKCWCRRSMQNVCLLSCSFTYFLSVRGVKAIITPLTADLNPNFSPQPAAWLSLVWDADGVVVRPRYCAWV